MGFFSWKTMDTNKTIPNTHSRKKTSKVVLSDDKGNKWIEHDYDGYGVFGGKDYYQLVLEMNQPTRVTGNVEKDRLRGISLIYGHSGVRHVDKPWEMYLMGIDYTNWEQLLPMGMTPNQCMQHIDYEPITVKVTNVKFPNLSKSESWVWRNVEPENCEYQGYFYD